MGTKFKYFAYLEVMQNFYLTSNCYGFFVCSECTERFCQYVDGFLISLVFSLIISIERGRIPKSELSYFAFIFNPVVVVVEKYHIFELWVNTENVLYFFFMEKGINYLEISLIWKIKTIYIFHLICFFYLIGEFVSTLKDNM